MDIFQLIYENKIVEIRQLLATPGFNVNQQDRFRRTPLMMTIEKNNLEIVNILLNVPGIDVNVVSEDRNRTAMIISCIYCNIDIIRRLIQHGADLNVHDINGDTPLIIASCNNSLTNNENSQVVRELIIHGAIIDDRGESKTALIIASIYDKPEVVHELIIGGADLNLQDENGNTALIWAIAYECVEIVNELILHSAIVTTVNNGGDTALTLTRGIQNRQIINAVEETIGEVREAVIKVYGEKTNIGGSAIQLLLEYIGTPAPVNIMIGGFYYKLQKYLNKK
jgi:ankyrin repeat protein